MVVIISISTRQLNMGTQKIRAQKNMGTWHFVLGGLTGTLRLSTKDLTERDSIRMMIKILKIENHMRTDDKH